MPKKDLFELTLCLAIAHQISKLICFLLNWTKKRIEEKDEICYFLFIFNKNGNAVVTDSLGKQAEL